jgi:hypothetical protein
MDGSRQSTIYFCLLINMLESALAEIRNSGC